MRHTTNSPQRTRAIASLLAREIGKTHIRRSGALIVALTGNLGSGKTTFIQGFARGPGILQRTPSPTFTLMRRYVIPKRSPAYRSGFRSLVHMDAYRVHSPSELSVIHFHEWISDPSAIVLVEWADLIRRLLPKDILSVRLAHQKDRNTRSVTVGS